MKLREFLSEKFVKMIEDQCERNNIPTENISVASIDKLGGITIHVAKDSLSDGLWGLLVREVYEDHAIHYGGKPDDPMPDDFFVWYWRPFDRDWETT